MYIESMYAYVCGCVGNVSETWHFVGIAWDYDVLLPATSRSTVLAFVKTWQLFGSCMDICLHGIFA